MAFIPNSNSVVAFQSDPTKLVGTVSVVGVNFGNSSIITVHQGSVATVQLNTPSPSVIAYQAAGSVMAVSGTFSATPQGSIIAIQAGGSVQAVRTDNASVIAVLSNSSVAVLQGTTPWQVNVPTPSYIAYQAAGSIMAVSGSFSANPQSSIIAIQLAGSVMAVSATVNTGNSSVQLLGGTATIGSVTALQGTNPYVMTGSVQGTMSVLGTVPVTQSTTPWVINMPSPSMIAYQLAGSVMAVAATVNTGNSSVQLLGGVAAIGSVAVLQGTNPWQVNVPTPSYIAYQLAGSIMAVNATVTTGPSSVQLLSTSASIQTAQVYGYGSVMLMTSTNASIAAAQSGIWNIGSIVGTYAEDVASAGGDKGIMHLGLRNDAVASTVNADLDYIVPAHDSAGRTLTKPFAADEGRIDYVGSIVSTSITLIAASVTGKRNYITDFMIANTGSVATLITFKDGSTSILGYTIGPATSGANKNLAMPIRTNPGQDLVFQPGTAVSILYVTIKGYQAP